MVGDLKRSPIFAVVGHLILQRLYGGVVGLWETVVRPVSLQQMLKEQRYVGELRSALDDEFIDPTESAYVDEVDSEDESMLDFE